MSYKESLGLALQEGALDVVLRLVGDGAEDAVLCHETLRMLASLLSHRKFSLVFLEAAGLRWCPVPHPPPLRRPAPTHPNPHLRRALVPPPFLFATFFPPPFPSVLRAAVPPPAPTARARGPALGPLPFTPCPLPPAPLAPCPTPCPLPRPCPPPVRP